jgi:folate-binding protein YgfZ
MMVPDQLDLEKSYERAFSTALWVQHASPGLLSLRGGDRLDLLNRISTNDVLGLPSGAMRRTILTNALARVVDVTTLFSRADDLLLMTSPKYEAEVEAWVKHYIFFQDDVQISRVRPELMHWGIYGPEASTYLEDFVTMLPPTEPDRFHVEGDLLLWQVSRPKPGGFELLVGENLHESIRMRADELNQGTAENELFELLRIESGIPRLGTEITQETIPLEVGLWDEVSFEKGCYTGQEILARMESRHQLARRLVLVACDSKPAPGMVLRLGKQDVGRMTSVAHSPQHGWIGLALVKATALFEEGLIAGEDSIQVRILDPLQSARVSKRT